MRLNMQQYNKFKKYKKCKLLTKNKKNSILQLHLINACENMDDFCISKPGLLARFSLFIKNIFCRNLSNELSRFLQYLVLLYTDKKGDNRLLKKLNKKEINRFIKKFEIKCSSITLENIQEDYFIIIDELIRFQINDHNLIKEYI